MYMKRWYLKWIEEINQVTEILDVQGSDENDFVEGEDVLFAQIFFVNLNIKTEHEPTNIKDSITIKFSIFHNNKWYMMI